MPDPLKVYVASSLDQNTINQMFQWPDGFQKTTNRDEAEFVVFDAVNMPDDWMDFWGKKPNYYVPTDSLPVFFVALGGNIDPLFSNVIQKRFKPITPPIYSTPADLFFVLQWLRCIFPFHNQSKIPDIEKLIGGFVLSKLKA